MIYAHICPPFSIHSVETDIPHLDVEIYNDGIVSFEVDCFSGYSTFDLTIADLEDLLVAAKEAKDTAGGRVGD